MKTNEHKGFEISMFTISVILALAVIISVIWLAIYFHNANASKITDAEADEGSVTESAIVADEDEDPDATKVPDGNVVVKDTDDYDDEVDPDLKDAEYGYTTAVVNLRSSASLTASVVTKVPMGVRVKLISMTKDNWMEVSYKGTTGFIHARYLSAKRIEPLATVEPTDEPKITAAPTSTPYTTPTKKPLATKRPKKTKKPVTPEPAETDVPIEDTPEPTEAVTPKPTDEPTQRPTKEPTALPSETKAAGSENSNE